MKSFLSYSWISTLFSPFILQKQWRQVKLKLKFQVKYAKVGCVTIMKLNFHFVLQISSNLIFNSYNWNNLNFVHKYVFTPFSSMLKMNYLNDNIYDFLIIFHELNFCLWIHGIFVCMVISHFSQGSWFHEIFFKCGPLFVFSTQYLNANLQIHQIFFFAKISNLSLWKFF